MTATEPGSAPAVSAPDRPGSGGFAPLRIAIFRWLFISGVVSNIGGWMQTVGAQWFLVEQHASPIVIALVSTASAVPVLLFGIPAGVLGEFANRRLLLITVQSVQAATAAVLAILTAVGSMTPSLLLLFTFLLGVASAVQLPAYQAIVPEVVPSKLVTDAASLSSVGVNVARAIGPAIAGLVIASLGIPFVFALNAVSFAGLLVVLGAWRSYRRPETDHEPFIAATRAGLRYVAHGRLVRRTYLQLLIFIVPANALWALLPVLSSSRLGLDANGYGLVLGALGVGSIVGAGVLPRARRRLGTNRLILISSAVYGLGMAGAAASRSLLLTLPVLVVVGLAWIGVIATTNGTVQSFLPGWVRSRGLSVFQFVLFGGTAAGAALAGAAGQSFGTAETMVGAGAAVVVGSLLLFVWPLLSTTDIDRTTDPMPLTDVPPVALPDSRSDEGNDGSEPEEHLDPLGATLVIVRYDVAPADRTRFIEAMRPVEESRRRTGARTWNLYDDRERPGWLVEVFEVGSWAEHLSQHTSRTTRYDSDLVEAAQSLARTPPTVEHLVDAIRHQHQHSPHRTDSGDSSSPADRKKHP